MFKMTALELSSAIKAKKFSVGEVVSAHVEKIEKESKKYNAFITVSKEQAFKRAEEIQSLVNNGAELSPLAGVPIALKDNISTKGIETTCASKMLQDYKPVFNATVVDRLEEAGLIVIGKLNMDEFAMGSSGELGLGGPVCNPKDITRSAGGSSSGSAAAVAAGLVPLSLGSDTGGSIRQPSSFCGIVGIKPTYGALSRHGLIACASSLDQIGPMGKNINDCAALLTVISGADNMDATCILEKPFQFTASTEKLDGIKIGLPKNYLEICEESIKLAILAAAKEFEAAGAAVEEFEMPLMDYTHSAYYAIAYAEGSSNLSRYDGLKFGWRNAEAKSLSDTYRLSRGEGFGAEVKKRILLGSFVLSAGNYDAYYRKALQVRSLVKDAYNELFKKYDIILSPVTPTTAPKLGENKATNIFNAPVNLAGLPAAAIPCGLDLQGLPVGFQLIGPAFSEDRLVNAARVYESLRSIQ
jgi:aspartyl-tRNA(Asn)/glutamyl-tRNA(Gln) amidotransferase subunit A